MYKQFIKTTCIKNLMILIFQTLAKSIQHMNHMGMFTGLEVIIYMLKKKIKTGDLNL